MVFHNKYLTLIENRNTSNLNANEYEIILMLMLNDQIKPQFGGIHFGQNKTSNYFYLFSSKVVIHRSIIFDHKRSQIPAIVVMDK